MKRKILFVDDEPLILQGLQRSMRAMRDIWDMQFVDSGVKALEAMSKGEFDVIISDMRMPGMNGAQLLNEIMLRYPKTVRLILSGHADQDLVMRSVGSTHQYLTKPCDPDALRATIDRATALGDSFKDERLKNLIAKMSVLPSLPTLYIEVTEALQNGDASAHDIGAIVAKDIAMCAQILKLVNSAFFSRSRKITSAVEATTFLGIDTIKSLMLCLRAFSKLDESLAAGFKMDSLWSHSLTTAANARGIVRLMNRPQKMVDEAYVSGLLHDAGRLVLAANFPGRYQSVVAEAAANRMDLMDAERNEFGATHADVGGYLLGLWGLPVPVVEAIAFHHDPSQCRNAEFSPLTAVHVGNVLAHESLSSIRVGGEAVLDMEYLNAAGVELNVTLWRETLREEAA